MWSGGNIHAVFRGAPRAPKSRHVPAITTLLASWSRLVRVRTGASEAPPQTAWRGCCGAASQAAAAALVPPLALVGDHGRKDRRRFHATPSLGLDECLTPELEGEYYYSIPGARGSDGKPAKAHFRIEFPIMVLSGTVPFQRIIPFPENARRGIPPGVVPRPMPTSVEWAVVRHGGSHHLLMSRESSFRPPSYVRTGAQFDGVVSRSFCPCIRLAESPEPITRVEATADPSERITLTYFPVDGGSTRIRLDPDRNVIPEPGGQGR
jgi:hypothetical protein